MKTTLHYNILFCIALLIASLTLSSCSEASTNQTIIDIPINKPQESTSQPPVTSENSIEIYENSFDARKVELGNVVQQLTITSLDVTTNAESDYFAFVAFEGEVTMSGQLLVYGEDESNAEGWGLGNLFQPDEKSTIKLPVLNIEPNRTSLTIVDNEEQLLKQLPPGAYDVTIVINNFEIWYQGKGQENKANLVKLNYELIK